VPTLPSVHTNRPRFCLSFCQIFFLRQSLPARGSPLSIFILRHVLQFCGRTAPNSSLIPGCLRLSGSDSFPVLDFYCPPAHRSLSAFPTRNLFTCEYSSTPQGSILLPARRWSLAFSARFSYAVARSVSVAPQSRSVSVFCEGFLVRCILAHAQASIPPPPCRFGLIHNRAAHFSLSPNGSSAARLYALLRVSTFQFVFAGVANQNSVCRSKLLIV
jgi:hypothetical protein